MYEKYLDELRTRVDSACAEVFAAHNFALVETRFVGGSVYHSELLYRSPECSLFVSWNWRDCHTFNLSRPVASIEEFRALGSGHVFWFGELMEGATRSKRRFNAVDGDDPAWNSVWREARRQAVTDFASDLSDYYPVMIAVLNRTIADSDPS